MLAMPNKSVTRFFIPLIDVLTLLFAVFLIMPVTQGSGEQEDPRLANKTPEEKVAYLERDNKRVREAMVKLRQDVDQQEKVPPKPRILEIDPNTGELFDSDADRTPIKSKEQARALIQHDLRLYTRSGWKLPYTILCPRLSTGSGHPTAREQEEYTKWFQVPDVALYWDNPGQQRK